MLARQTSPVANPTTCRCGGALLTVYPTKDSPTKETVCSKCGIVAPVISTNVGGPSVYGRSPTSHCVYGDALGTNHTTKDSNGKNFLYEARGSKGIFPYYDPETKTVVAGASIMPGHISGLEEDKRSAKVKENISRVCLNAKYKGSDGCTRKMADEFVTEEIATTILSERRESFEGVGVTKDEARDQVFLENCDTHKLLVSLIKGLHEQLSWKAGVVSS